MNNWRILQGDVRDRLADLEAGSVRCCVTSPPFYGLRDYGTAKWEGGDPACDHKARSGAERADGGVIGAGIRSRDGVSGLTRTHCKTCGAKRVDQQIGLEESPEAYVEAMVGVFREVRRVMADDATLWLNLGDSYAASGRGGNPDDSPHQKQRTNRGSRTFFHAEAVDAGAIARKWVKPPAGYKQKDLIGIPWMVAFALRADGWYLRSDIIWSKPNPMPESVTDRPTKAHEYIFLLSKSRSYYYDAEAIAEQVSDAMLKQVEQGYYGEGTKDYEAAGVQNPSSVKARIIANAEKKRGQCYQNTGNIGMDARWSKERRAEILTRNKRSVWQVATHPYPDAHFATFPEALITPCILAGSAHGDTVLDPFTGSGTTGAVAIRHQRNFVGCELNPAYVELARKRINAVAPMFAQEVA